MNHFTLLLLVIAAAGPAYVTSRLGIDGVLTKKLHQMLDTILRTYR